MSDVESRLEGIGAVLNSLGTELAISLADSRVLGALLAAVILAATCALAGTWMARRVGLLSRDVPHGETLGVGLGLGLLVLAAWWAAIASGGRSSFTPVAVAFALALLCAGRILSKPDSASSAPRGSVVPVALAAVAMVVGVGLLYGITLAPSPREGAQPIEFYDVAYYSVLGADLARTGTESIYSPSGFEQLPGLASQSWYHWGEIWLAAATVSVAGIDPIFARHYVVLPVVLLAAAALTGTLVRRLAGTSSRGAFLFGACACLLLAPLPFLFPGPHFTKWASGLIYGITLYGLGTISALLSMYVATVVTVRPGLNRSWSLSLISGAVVASMVSTHIVVAILALIGASGAGAVFSARAILRTKRVPSVTAAWRGTLAATALIGSLTIGMGVVTGHQLGASALSEGISPFDGAWVQTIMVTTLGAGALLAIPVALLVYWHQQSVLAWLSLAATIALVFGAVAWGARFGDFNMFHVYFGALVVFGTPVAAAAVVALWREARVIGRRRAATAVFVLCGVQLGLGGVLAVVKLQVGFGPMDYQPIPLEVLDAIERLPMDAKLAYSCGATEEAAFGDPALGSIDAHTGRPVVPMCFHAEVFTWLITGNDNSTEVANPYFELAPQSALYPDSKARPSAASVAAFLKRHRIAYIYADGAHPNRLVPEAVPLATSGAVQLLRIP